MREYLFIRFFASADDPIPYEVQKVGHKSDVSAYNLVNNKHVISISTWMNDYPNGKVEFMWAHARGIL